MQTIAKTPTTMQAFQYFGPATVLDCNDDEGLVLLSFKDDLVIWGRSAIGDPHGIESGDSVLAAGDELNGIFVIGMIKKAKPEAIHTAQLQLKEGGHARVERTADSEAIQIFSSNGQLVFEYEPDAGKSRINIQAGDLEFVTHDGDIRFISKGDIHFKSDNQIDISSRNGVQLAISDAIGKILATLSLRHKKISLNSPEVDVHAQRGKLEIDEAEYSGHSLSGAVNRVQLMATRLETTATDVFSKAKNIYKTVASLHQLKAGRMRTLINSTLHIKAKKTYLRAEDDFKVKSEKIHLG